ncbi:hypothetical protein D0T51_05005 [Parabacteroides sp. 52]|uniref:hypothetical protein n=1 Tax=unclassified Parabacteroides TaxID=2649774 RepID=UPI0013D833B3|nr:MULTISPECIES: hypothetical protein [unclassified Parabacteroides]MDH6534462.1 hypothetical protein [Parabacteroides sp. PM5-20]NDV55088.1 hypothetical protein [Parabacteroides sp. 52]
MDKEDNLGRVLALLLIALLVCVALYALPDEMFGYKIKKVDLLSDIRVKPAKASLDSIKQFLQQADTVVVDTVAIRESVMQSTGIDSTALALRDSLYKAAYAVEGADVSGTHIEDYSPGHIGLKRFFMALNKRHEMKRPVRIAFMGDSFIEGDILVADFRAALQKEFGGRGVGFVPMSSVTAQFRPTVGQKMEGWKTWSMLNDQEQAYVLSGTLFEPDKEGARLSLKNSLRYPSLTEVSSVKLLYEQNEKTRMQLVLNGEADTLSRVLPPTTAITQNIMTGDIREVEYIFSQTEGFRALGVALEDESGVIVDNFSLRGNSGMILDRLHKERCKELTEIRPYDLIVLQYGLNVVSEDMIEYGWYSQRMVKVVAHLQACFPQADILLLSVTDRSHQVDGRFETMPEVLAMIHAQRQIAKRSAIPFWNMFGAMGGENSMVQYVEKNWASKDYTHMGFRGGKELARALMHALLLEKEFYDEAEHALH